MIKYEKYKSSDVDYIGEIPYDWSIKRLKDIVKEPLKYGANEPAIDENKDEPRYIRITDFGENEVLKSNTYKSLKFELAKDYFLKLGDILFARSGATVGKTFQFKNYNGLACYAGYLIKATPNQKLINSDYLSFFTKSISYDEWKNNIFIQATIQNISAEKYDRLEISIPSIELQKKIVNFLNLKTQAIDKKINLLSQKVNYYKEFRKSLINEAVCKGLDKNVNFKDSEVDWLDKIPYNWNMKRIKDGFNLSTGNSISDKELYEIKDNSIDYVSTKDIDIDSGKINYDNGIYIQLTDKSFKIAKANSTLICIEGASAGKKIGFTDKDVCFVNKLCAIKSLDKSNYDKYFFYYTQSSLFEKQFFSKLNGLIGGVSINLIKYFNVLLPSKNDQIEIANYLDKKTHNIDDIISNINKQIEILKELRKTLINDVVTGKIKVTN